jgi:hypothetical protein
VVDRDPVREQLHELLELLADRVGNPARLHSLDKIGVAEQEHSSGDRFDSGRSGHLCISSTRSVARS